MNVSLINHFCVVALLILISSCVREDLSGCPPSKYEVRVSVKDKNYCNIENFSNLVRISENSSFNSYVKTVCYILTESTTGEIVKESSITPVSKGIQTYSITFDDVPTGKYMLAVWGNVNPEHCIGMLHQDNEECADVYLGSTVLEFGPNYQPVNIPLERVKGKLVVICSNFPSVVTSVEQHIKHVCPMVDVYLNYTGDTHVQKRIPFQEFITTSLSPTSGEASKLKLRFFADELDSVTPFFELPEMELAVRRNEVSAVSVDYKAMDRVWEVQVFVQGEWITLHRLTIE